MFTRVLTLARSLSSHNSRFKHGATKRAEPLEVLSCDSMLTIGHHSLLIYQASRLVLAVPFTPIENVMNEACNPSVQRAPVAAPPARDLAPAPPACPSTAPTADHLPCNADSGNWASPEYVAGPEKADATHVCISSSSSKKTLGNRQSTQGTSTCIAHDIYIATQTTMLLPRESMQSPEIRGGSAESSNLPQKLTDLQQGLGPQLVCEVALISPQSYRDRLKGWRVWQPLIRVRFGLRGSSVEAERGMGRAAHPVQEQRDDGEGAETP